MLLESMSTHLAFWVAGGDSNPPHSSLSFLPGAELVLGRSCPARDRISHLHPGRGMDHSSLWKVRRGMCPEKAGPLPPALPPSAPWMLTPASRGVTVSRSSELNVVEGVWTPESPCGDPPTIGCKELGPRSLGFVAAFRPC